MENFVGGGILPRLRLLKTKSKAMVNETIGKSFKFPPKVSFRTERPFLFAAVITLGLVVYLHHSAYKDIKPSDPDPYITGGVSKSESK